MLRPKIKVAGKIYELPKPKCGMWRKMLEFDKGHGEIFAPDFVEKRCEFLAEVYGDGLTATELMDNLYLEEILPAYREVVNYILGSISTKMAQVEKNVDAGEETDK